MRSLRCTNDVRPDLQPVPPVRAPSALAAGWLQPSTQADACPADSSHSAPCCEGPPTTCPSWPQDNQPSEAWLPDKVLYPACDLYCAVPALRLHYPNERQFPRECRTIPRDEEQFAEHEKSPRATPDAASQKYADRPRTQVATGTPSPAGAKEAVCAGPVGASNLVADQRDLVAITAAYVPCDAVQQPIYLEPQYRNCCGLHAINNALQAEVVNHDTARAWLHRTTPVAEDSGWYYTAELSELLSVVSGGALALRFEGYHCGLSKQHTWDHTLSELKCCNASMLILLSKDRGLPPMCAKHAVCAVVLELDDNGPAWYVLDSNSSDHVIPLSDALIAHNFNVDVFSIAWSDAPRRQAHELPTRAQALCTMGRGPGDPNDRPYRPVVTRKERPTRGVRTPATTRDSLLIERCAPQSSPLYPQRRSTCERASPAPGPPVYLRIHMPTQHVNDRPLFLATCTRLGLDVLARAKYEKQSNSRGEHLLLTITQPDHLDYLSMTPIQYFVDNVRTATKTRTQAGWHVIPCDAPKKLDTSARQVSSFAMRRIQPPPQTMETLNRFACLAEDEAPCERRNLPVSQNQARSRFHSRRQQAHASSEALQPSHHLRLASWNVNGVNVSESNPDSRHLVEAALQAHDVHVCAVQETHIREREDKHADMYTLHGEPADPAMICKGGGVGFLVHSEFASVFTYLGSRHPATAHRLTWARLLRPLGHDHVYIASVYMPDLSGYTIADYELVLEHLSLDFAYYSMKSSNVVMLGDFNAQVAAQRSGPESSMTEEEPEQGPVFSHSCQSNRFGKLLSAWCASENAYFLSGRTLPSAVPTFTRAGHTTAIDFILGTPGNISWAQTITVSARHDCSDHHLIHMDIPWQYRLCAVPAAPLRTTRWRTVLLHTGDTRARYSAEISDMSARVHALLDAQLKDDTAAEIDAALAAVMDMIHVAASKHIGTTTVVAGVTKRWMTRDLSAKLRHRRSLYRTWAQNRTTSNWTNLQVAWSETRRAVKEAKYNKHKKACSHVNALWRDQPGTKLAYARLKAMAQTDMGHTTIDALTRADSDTLATSVEDKLKVLSDHYKHAAQAPVHNETDPVVLAHHRHVTSTVQALADRMHCPGAPARAELTKLNKPIQQQEVAACIAGLKVCKAPGIDGMPAELLKAGGECLERIVAKLFNLIWQTETVPEQWRQGVVVSLHKQGSKADPGNYRPITLLPVLDKLYMTVLTKRLQDCVPLHDHQFAFREKRGTIDALFCLDEPIKLRTSRGQHTYVLFHDIKKAYDTVWLDGLLYKLHHKGVQGQIWRMIRNMYKSARSAPRLDGVMGDSYAIHQGVAQGCPMSPILFDVFIDELIESLSSPDLPDGVCIGPTAATQEGFQQGAIGYADDIAAATTTPEGMNLRLRCAELHGRMWKSAANVPKCKIMVCAPRKQAAAAAEAHKSTFIYEGQILQVVPAYKQLGVMLSADSTWQAQGAYALQRLQRTFHAWKRALQDPAIEIKVKLHIIKTFIKPVATYGMELWDAQQRDHATQKAVNHLDVALRRILRTAMGLPIGPMGRFLPTALLHSDTGVRCFKDDMTVAHLRYMRKMEGQHGIDILTAVTADSKNCPRNAKAPSWWQRTAVMKAHVDAAVAKVEADRAADSDAQAQEGHSPATTSDSGPAEPGSDSAASSQRSNQALNQAVHTYRKQLLSKSEPEGMQWLLQEAVTACDMYLTTGRSQQAAALFALRAGLLPADLTKESHLALPSAARPNDCQAPLYLTCPDCHKDITDEFDAATNAMHDSELAPYRLQRLHEHRVTECQDNKESRWWLVAALGRILGQTAASAVLSKKRRDWRQHIVAALTDYWTLRERELIEPHQQAKFHSAVACYMRSLTKRGHKLPSLDVYGDIESDESDDEFNFMTGQCSSSATVLDDAAMPTPMSSFCTVPKSPVNFRSVSAWPMVQIGLMILFFSNR